MRSISLSLSLSLPLPPHALLHSLLLGLGQTVLQLLGKSVLQLYFI